jgi:hypothetical protein
VGDGVVAAFRSSANEKYKSLESSFAAREEKAEANVVLTFEIGLHEI